LLELPDHVGHGGGRGAVDLELVGSVILIAEHHGIESGCLQRGKIAGRRLDQPGETALPIMQRRSRQGSEMKHADHRLAAAEYPLEVSRHVSRPRSLSPSVSNSLGTDPRAGKLVYHRAPRPGGASK